MAIGCRRLVREMSEVRVHARLGLGRRAVRRLAGPSLTKSRVVTTTLRRTAGTCRASQARSETLFRQGRPPRRAHANFSRHSDRVKTMQPGQRSSARRRSRTLQVLQARSEGLQDNVQRVLDPALRLIIVGEGCDKLTQPTDPERSEVKWIENVTLPPHHKYGCHAGMLATELRHGLWPHERRDDPGRHPREIVRLQHDDEGAHRTPRGDPVHAEPRRRNHRLCISSDRLPCAS